MKTMAASRTGSGIIQISLIWITALIIAPSHSQDVPRIKDLDCVNDFVTKMVCFWEVVNRNTNCSSDFRLKYTDFNKIPEDCKDLDNEYNGSIRVLNKCICNINVVAIVAGESYLIEVESQGQSVSKATIDMFSSVKPKTPSDLRVAITEPDNGVVRWKTNYEDSFIGSKLSFHIQFISKEDNKMALEDNITQVEPQYPFNRRQLTRGHDYRVRVRSKLTKNRQIWSEWSPEFVYKNDYDLTMMDWTWTILSVCVIVILLLMVSCYFCITRTKERWWNNIPNPARSKLAHSRLFENNYLKPTGKSIGRKSCGNYLSELGKAHKSKHEQFTKELLTKDYLNVMENMKTIIFEPEKVDIERCIQMYPRQDDNLYQEDSPEDKEEDIHLMATDLSIGRMFCDILCEPSVKVLEMEQLHVDNTFGSFGSSILRDNSKTTERHLPLSMVSQESGYHSYDSDDSPGDSKSDGSNPLYLGSLSESDFLPYAPVPSINQSGSHLGKEDAFVNSGYNSFASALGETASDFLEGDIISAFSLGTIPCKPNYHHSLQNPKSILYYNTSCFPTCYEDDLRPTITPTLVHRIETRPPSVSEEPGYQSFNQAVQQGDTTRSINSLVFDSGYKPFESLTRISTSSLDSISGSSELDGVSVQNNEDLQQTEMANGGIDPLNDTQSSGFPLKEFNFFDRKYTFYSETLDEHKYSVNQASDIHFGINRTLNKADNPLALTFDIGDHLRNLANIQGPEMLAGFKYPTNLISFPCFLNETPIIHDNLLDKNSLHTGKSFPMKFENMSYFAPVYYLKTEGYSHVLLQQNHMDEEGNSYMKIALW